MHVGFVIIENFSFTMTSNNDQCKHIPTTLTDSSRCQNDYTLYFSQVSLSLNRSSSYLYTENEVLLSQILQQEAAGYSVTPIPEETLTSLFLLAFLQWKRLSRNSISNSLS